MNLNDTGDQVFTSDLTAAAEAHLGRLESEAQGTSPDAQRLNIEDAAALQGRQEQRSETQVETQVEPGTPQAVDLPDDALIRLKVNGQEKLVPFKDLRDGGQRQETFTQRTQALAEQRRQLEQYAQQQQAALIQEQRALAKLRQEIMQQANPLNQLIQQQMQQQQQPQKNPNEIATLGELQALQAQWMQQLQATRQQDQQSFQQALIQTKAEAQEAARIERDQARFAETVESIMNSDDGQLLAEINPEAAALIKWNVWKMQPETTEQAMDYAKKAAKDWADSVRGRLSRQAQVSAVSAAKKVLETPSGSTPSIVQTKKEVSLKSDGSIDWDALRRQAEALLP